MKSLPVPGFESSERKGEGGWVGLGQEHHQQIPLGTRRKNRPFVLRAWLQLPSSRAISRWSRPVEVAGLRRVTAIKALDGHAADSEGHAAEVLNWGAQTS